VSNPEPAQPDYTLVRYHDGSEQLCAARMGDVVAFEIERDRPPNTKSVADVTWLIWRGLGKPHDDFQTWADSVSELVTDDAEIAAAVARLDASPPTKLAAAGGG
jgi:hypothetical protein